MQDDLLACVLISCVQLSRHNRKQTQVLACMPVAFSYDGCAASMHQISHNKACTTCRGSASHLVGRAMPHPQCTFDAGMLYDSREKGVALRTKVSLSLILRCVQQAPSPWFVIPWDPPALREGVTDDDERAVTL
jgi:hypothetical protein